MPDAHLEYRGAQAVEESQRAAQQGLEQPREQPREIQQPENLHPMHEWLM